MYTHVRSVSFSTLLRSIVTVAIALSLGLVSGCDRAPAIKDINVAFPGAATGNLAIHYPLQDTLFPPDVAAPLFQWQDDTDDVARWLVLVQLDGQSDMLRFATDEPAWRPDSADWQTIKSASVEQHARVAVVGLDERGAARSAAKVRIQTSEDPVGDAIFYREVPLPFIAAVQDPSKIRWRFGTVDSTDPPPVVLDNLPVCGNCHSFSKDGSTLGLDVDYGNDKGGYAILPVAEQMTLADENIMTWSDYQRDDGEGTFGLLSQVSPDGRYVISTVKDRAVFVATPGIEFSQLFFPIKGILVVYDTKTGQFARLPGADDPTYVQSNPTWSPDGKYVVFARAKAYQREGLANATSVLLDEKDVPEFIEDNQPYKFDLYRVPFNGGRGGEAQPLAGASHNGKSNFFAKYSPDGQWIVFTQAENYMLLMPDSELFIIPADGGDARRLAANTARMNSWHSFSSNSRWLVFSSKINTPYTQLFLTHIDKYGNSSPAVVLDRFTNSDRAANIPEFVPRDGDAIARIEERFLDAYSFLRAGMANERTGNYPQAISIYERGLNVEPDNVELLNSLGFALFQKGDSEQAVTALEKALTIDPRHAKAHNNMALASIDLGELELAEAHYRESLAIEPQAPIYNDLGFVLERQGLIEDAADAYRQALDLDPEADAARYNLGASLARAGQYEEAERHLLAAVKTHPTTQAFTALGVVQRERGANEEAMSSFGAAIEADPKNAAPYDQLGAMLVAQGKLTDAETLYRQLVVNRPSPAAHEELAQVLTRLGRSSEAAQELARARALDSGVR
jgi:tetratricopeptide (TPR) repeat protein